MSDQLNIDLVSRFWGLMSEQRWGEANDLLHPEFIAEWPQSRERMRGAESFIAVNRNYPGNHRIKVIHIDAIADRVITTVWVEADTGQKTFATSYFNLRDGKIIRAEEYWAEPYEAPSWRSQWVEVF